MLSPPHQQELEAAFLRFGPVIYRRCLKLLKDAALAQDATQEVFLKLTRDFERLKDRESCLPWIYEAATHHCLNLRRSAYRKTRNENRYERAPDIRPVEFSDRLLGQQVLQRFDTTTQAIAIGVLVDGMQHDELATALGVSRKTVGRKLERFLVGARKFLDRS